MHITEQEWIAIEREACSRSLEAFVCLAWHVLEPSMRYVHGWHVDTVCEHLEAVTDGRITRLLINIPPGTMKSTLTAVFWPAWEWGPKNMPSMRMIGASHEEGLAIRDTLKMRRLVESQWYQDRWPLKLRKDQNEKMYYENGDTGFRQACSVKSMTGRRGDRVVWDDPHNVEGALSEAERKTAVRVFRETLTTRLNDPIRSAIVIVMQRLHEEDVSGVILAEQLDYVHLCLPMEFEADHRCKTSIGWEDPRTEEGELLFPERFPREVVERDKKVLGAMATAGQFQQRPAPRTGGFFEWSKIEIVDAHPQLVMVIRYWDKAGTEGGGAWTAGVKMGLGVDGLYYILHCERGQWAAPGRERVIKQTAATDGYQTSIWIEQEPGSGGKESADATIAKLAGYVIESECPTGEKPVRAIPFSIQVEAGNVRMVRGEWNKDYLDEVKLFPASKYKDQVDASSGAFNKLAVPSAMGILLRRS